MSRILIVDDVEAMREQYAYDIKRLGGHETLTATGGSEALQILEREPIHCLILDLEMPGVDGFEVLRTLQHRGGGPPVIVYTGTGDVDRCARAMKLGAYGFIEKKDAIERVLIEIDRVLEKERIGSQLARSRGRLGEGRPLVGGSERMRALCAQIDKLAPIPSTVLVTGESGSGKELVAQRLHGASGRSGSFLALNCSAFPEQTLEDELFGHGKGAFTGADRPRKGAFEEAQGGTLFLDEIGELPPPAQAKLLRVLEEKKIMRLGSSQAVSVEVRVVAATNRDLAAEVAAGRFREDLLYRLRVHSIRVPPLREHIEDLPEIAAALLEKICGDFGCARRTLAPAAILALARYDWRRNNVRELRNALEQMLISCDGEIIGPEHMPAELWTGGAEPVGEDEALSFRHRRLEAERQIVGEALGRNGGQVTLTARELGLADHSSLIKLMRRLGIER